MNQPRATGVITRRRLLQLSGGTMFCGLAPLGGSEVFSAPEKLMQAKEAVDHLLLGVSDLDAGIAWLEKLTGVRAVAGGSHPGRGTRNALLALGGKRYLEIIAPDPAQPAFDFQIDLRQLAAPRLITWAAATTDINALAQRARLAGYETVGPRDGARVRRDRSLLKWRTLATRRQIGSPFVHLIPFFIEWAADSVHPSQDSPPGCTLEALTMEHHAAPLARQMLRHLGIEVEAKVRKETRLRAVLKTPQGRIELF